jgi:phosphoribosylaminoimidazole-succinocarboxamide synthase
MVASLNTTPPTAVHDTRLTSLERIHRGKVRDVYAIDAASLLIVATDRLSAFDVILPDPIPGKGRILEILRQCSRSEVLGEHADR